LNTYRTTVENYHVAPFGEFKVYNSDGEEIQSSTIGNPYVFQGRQYDKETGIYYFRNRYYSPELRRFISRDPLGYDAGDINLYRFVGNNPYGGLDPMGLEEFNSINWGISFIKGVGGGVTFSQPEQSVENCPCGNNLKTVDESTVTLTGAIGYGGRFANVQFMFRGPSLNLNLVSKITTECDGSKSSEECTSVSANIGSEFGGSIGLGYSIDVQVEGEYKLCYKNGAGTLKLCGKIGVDFNAMSGLLMRGTNRIPLAGGDDKGCYELFRF
jgi:RHS repeat-associated protein